MKILITGGAGFVGANLARLLQSNFPDAKIVIFDNLKRRGSELNIPFFKQNRILFVHGDVRQLTDLQDLDGNFDVMIEASAEPSVLAGVNDSPNYVVQTNLVGALNCLEFARQRCGGIIFLSTSRVYSIAPLCALPMVDTGSRLQLDDKVNISGISQAGISEDFCISQTRSIYGTTKLASEFMIQEYAEIYRFPSVINRCGVIAGPGQFGKADQGVFTLWVANHYFGKPLRYTGFGGTGKQVRDLLHPEDLFTLIQKQISCLDEHYGQVYNVGGGPAISTSLLELTNLCQEVTGQHVSITAVNVSSNMDIPWYISDARLAMKQFNWKPTRTVKDIVWDIYRWIQANESQLRILLE